MAKEWISIVKRKRSPFINYFCFEGISDIYNRIGDFDYRYKYELVYIEDEYFIERTGFRKFEAKIIGQLKKDKSFLLKVTKKAYTDIKEYMKAWKKISKTGDFGRLSSSKLASILEEYSLTMLKWCAYYHFPTFCETVITDRLEKIVRLNTCDERQFREYFLIFTAPLKQSFQFEENVSMLKILAEIQKSPKAARIVAEADEKNALKMLPKEITALIKMHLAEFSWLANIGFWNEFMQPEDIMRRLKEKIGSNASAELEKIGNPVAGAKKQCKSAIARLGLGKDDAKLIDTVREYVYFRSFRTEIMYKSGFYIRELIEEAAKRLKTTPLDALYLLPPEIIGLLKEGKSADAGIIEERKKGHCFSKEGQSWEIYSGKALDEFRKRCIINRKKDVRDITGSCACPGVVEGRVKVVASAKELSKVMEGDILVTSMTTPDFVPAMEKAAGFVTDEGGILCHAAIVSREMAKPCIIGTSNATQLLKDGDLIRVNASHGLVTIIKRANRS